MHPTYSRTHPFLATITERYPLTKAGSSKETYHLVLNLRGSGIHYKPGDSIGIYPLNDPVMVSRILTSLEATGQEMVVTKTGEECLFRQFLSSKANLHHCSRALLGTLIEGIADPEEKAKLKDRLELENKDACKTYLEQRHVWDLLDELQTKISPQALTALLMPLLPRFYSIASSMSAVGEEAHFTVALTEYESQGHQRLGVASHYLLHLAPLHEPVVPIYLQPSKDFTLPAQDDAAMIMVGPGTGVAPYRGFLQERMIRQALGQNWLFFGECHRATDFFYEDYWVELETRGRLRLDAAFSRDQSEKIYVQHRLLAHGEEIYRWLQEGAYFYVCGDAEHMAKGVDQTLHVIFQQGGCRDAAEAVKALRKEKRYLRDVY
jgi:sulfite reductase (NADPH) flavoprotein alpha-component